MTSRQRYILIFAFEEVRKSLLLCYLFLFSDIVIQYPQFFGHSYVTFEPLKNSYQAFQITLEFRVRRITCLMSAYWIDPLLHYQLRTSRKRACPLFWKPSKHSLLTPPPSEITTTWIVVFIIPLLFFLVLSHIFISPKNMLFSFPCPRMLCK